MLTTQASWGGWLLNSETKSLTYPSGGVRAGPGPVLTGLLALGLGAPGWMVDGLSSHLRAIEDISVERGGVPV